MSFLLTASDRTKNCALGPPISIRYSGHFVITGYVIAGFVSKYVTVIPPGFQMLFVILNGVFVIAGFVIAECYCINISPA